MQTKARFSINIIENDENQILLLKRSQDSELGPGLWGFPAGHIEQEESPAACALRELKEEIGEQFSIKQINYLGPLRDSFYNGIYEIHLFHHHWYSGEIKLNEEHTEYAWVSKHEYKNYSVMDGLDEDIYYLKIWPQQYLNDDKLPI